jgi:hypothetical protein
MTVLRPIAHQFIDLLDHPERRACPECDLQQEPCPEYGPNDPFYLQLYNEPQPVTPCLGACDGGGIGEPCGTFLLNADMCKPTNVWSFTGNFGYLDPPDCGIVVSPAGLESTATLDVSQWQALTPGIYRLSFNLHVVYDGYVYLQVGTLTSPQYSAPGTYDWLVYLDGSNLFVPLVVHSSNDFYGDIISVRAGLANKFWTGYASGGWTLNSDACAWEHVPGTSNPLTFNYPVSNGRYKLTWRVEGVTDVQAWVDLYVGPYYFGRFYGNGAHVIYVDIGALPAVPTWSPSVTWDGVLQLEGFDRSYTGHQFALVTGVTVASHLQVVYYEGDYVTLGPILPYMLLDPFGDPVPPGCYAVAVWDETAAADNPFWEVVYDPGLQNLGAWTVYDPGTGGYYDWATDPAIPVPFAGNQFQGYLWRGNISQDVDSRLDPQRCYRLEIQVEPTIDLGGVAANMEGDLQVQLGAFDSGLIAITAPVTLTFDLAPIGPTGFQPLTLKWFDGTFAITNVSLRPCPVSLPVDFATFRSSCVALTAEVPCESNYVEGSVQGTYQTADGQWRSPIAYGFQWNQMFKLGQRVRTYFLNPTSDGDQDRYAYRDGRNLRTAGETERRWDLILGGLGYVSHDAMATLVKCQTVRLVANAPLLEAGTEYLVTDDEYNPQWPKGAHAHQADVQLEVLRLKKSRRYLRAIF